MTARRSGSEAGYAAGTEEQALSVHFLLTLAQQVHATLHSVHCMALDPCLKTSLYVP